MLRRISKVRLFIDSMLPHIFDTMYYNVYMKINVKLYDNRKSIEISLCITQTRDFDFSSIQHLLNLIAKYRHIIKKTIIIIIIKQINKQTKQDWRIGGSENRVRRRSW